MRSADAGPSPSPIHTADCGVYRGLAYEPGPCDCGAVSYAPCPAEMRRLHAVQGAERYREWERAGEVVITRERPAPASDRHRVDPLDTEIEAVIGRRLDVC